jgi:hypothetical protein
MTGVPALPSRSLSQDLMRTSQLPVFMEYLTCDRLSVPGQIVRKSIPIVSVGKKYKGEALDWRSRDLWMDITFRRSD